jgi:hypothetical protein
MVDITNHYEIQNRIESSDRVHFLTDLSLQMPFTYPYEELEPDPDPDPEHALHSDQVEDDFQETEDDEEDTEQEEETENTDTDAISSVKIKPRKLRGKYKKAEPNNTIIRVEDYENGRIVWKKYKISELKNNLKHYKLHITGNKPTLIQRLKEYFEYCVSSVKIQKIFRGYIVKHFFEIKGPAFKDRKRCVNETDSYTLEPVVEIEHERFFSFEDSNHFIYGFDIGGLLRLYKSKGKINNPYTRERLDSRILNNILFIGRTLPIIFPNILTEDEKLIPLLNLYRFLPSRRRVFPQSFQDMQPRQRHPPQPHPYPTNTIISHTNTNETINTNTNADRIIDHTQVNRRSDIMQRLNHLVNQNTINRNLSTDIVNTNTNTNTTPTRYTHHPTITFTNHQRELYMKIMNMRNDSIRNRIINLFVEIDLLGNYTQPSWFSNLNTHELCRYFRILFDIWNYRAHMSMETKLNICQFGNPFHGIQIPQMTAQDHYLMPNVYADRMKDSCLNVMEMIIFSGIDIEYRKLGALHILSALTVVSLEARQNMYWLYESLL